MDTDYPEYLAFLKSKVRLAESWGFVDVAESEVNPVLKPHQRATVLWNIRGGRRADFLSFGLGKTPIQLETLRLILTRAGGRALIVCPLGVRQEFARDAVQLLGWSEPPRFIRSVDEAGPDGIYLTNYESVRDGKINPADFIAVSLDEAAILRGFGGSKTFRELMLTCTGDGGPCNKDREDGRRVKYRFVATATPSPNDYIELLAYAEFLGVMDISQAKTRFFKRDSTKADNLTLHPHKEREFWLWVASWALFVQRPSDLGFDDTGYALPEMIVNWHQVATDHTDAGHEKSGQMKLIRDAAIGVQDAAAEKRISLPARIAKLMEIRAEDPAAHRIVWHDLEAEREAIEQAIPSIVSICGTDTDDHKESAILGFSDGKFQEVALKPSMFGAGVNLQRHCAWAVYLGVGFKFHEFIQSLHRIFRFLQVRTVRVDIIHTEAESGIRKQLERKWRQHNEMISKMTEIIREFGLSHAAMARTLTRKLGVERIEIATDRYRIVHHDCVLETRRMAANSVGLILTSIPFSSQYEYSPNFADFGHSEGNAEFFQQMDFLTPELLRVLQPGRIAAVHVKDRIVPMGMSGLGSPTVYPFHSETIRHYTRHGFAYMGMKTIVTDVVRENNQTYRLGWTEQCKDGSKMGVGMPEYLLYFRKPPTDTSNSYADTPVVKSKPLVRDKDGSAKPFGDGLLPGKKENRPIIPGTGYSRGRWQFDAHGFTRSSGNRLLRPDELATLKHEQIFKLFRDYQLTEVFNFEHVVKIGEALEASGKLPSDFMLLQPQSWSPEVWTDITRMLTLNGTQAAKGKEMHLCPMQFDLADRVITQLSNRGEVVYDPFGGLMTVPYRAILQGRFGVGCELSPAYFADGAHYCRMAAEEMSAPTLFDLAEFDADTPPTQPKEDAA